MTTDVGARSNAWPLALIGLLALVLTLGACGEDDEEISAGANDDVSAEPGDGPDPDSDTNTDTDTNTGTDYQPTTAEPDMISAEKAPISGVESLDDRTLAVRYSNGSEPCALANVLVDETDTSITVSLETGLHPNVAAMSCIAQIVDYEIRVQLDSPIGEREIIVDNP